MKTLRYQLVQFPSPDSHIVIIDILDIKDPKNPKRLTEEEYNALSEAERKEEVELADE
jgi:hypothetical protein